MTTTPRILYRSGDRPFSDTLYVCPNGDIAIYHRSLTITKPLEEWHSIGHQNMKRAKISGWRKTLINWLEN